MGFEQAGEAVVADPLTWRASYVGTRFLSFLAEALRDDPTATGTDCYLDVPGVPEISYRKDIVPLLANKCVTCHRLGGAGPWAMTDYTVIRGFAPMIREVVRTKRMPPWRADPLFGEFANDRSLSPHEARRLVQWIEAGAPHNGNGEDALQGDQVAVSEWSLGTPDLVVDIPEYEVPARGIVAYRYPTVKNPLDRDVWVRGIEIAPGDRLALHHALVAVDGSGDGGPASVSSIGSLGGYAPGDPVLQYPRNAGVLLPAGAVLTFQMHYTPYGRAVTDRSRVAFYSHDEPPARVMRVAMLANTGIRIPAYAKSHRETISRAFHRSVLIYSLLPHAHYRGKASEFRAIYPDGSEEVLLSVPKYDFNWQTNYVLREPKVLSAGTRIVHTTWWDNSSENLGNPDPGTEVRWGFQSSDEMMIGWITFSYINE